MIKRGHPATPANCSLRWAILLVASFLTAAPCTSGPQDDFSSTDALARELATRLSQSGIRSVVVFDLSGPDGQRLPFGAWAADQISNRLADTDVPIHVISRRQGAIEMQNEHLIQKNRLSLNAKIALSRSLGAGGCILGSFGPFKDQIGVTLIVYGTPKTQLSVEPRYLFMLNGKMPLDPDARLHLTVPLASLWPNDRIYKAGYAGMTVAECDSCPPPNFSASSVWRMKQGTVVMMIIVSAQGRVSDVKVIDSTDATLNVEAIKAIQNYRFKPAVDPDGRPARVRMPFSLTFRIKN